MIDQILNRALLIHQKDDEQQGVQKQDEQQVNAEMARCKRIDEGLQRIMELDRRLEERTKAYKKVKEQPPSEVHDQAEGDLNRPDTDEFENVAFVTQKASVKGQDISQTDEAPAKDIVEEEKMTADVSESGKKMDFIRRNIELAGESNYFFALTAEEKKRVERIIMHGEPPAESQADPNASEQHNPSDDTEDPWEEYGYLPIADELKKLSEIDTQLKKLIPPDEWERKSVISFNDEASILQRTGSVTDLEFWNGPSRATSALGNRTVDTVMHTDLAKPMIALREARKRIKQLDDQLDALKAQYEREPAAPLDKDSLNRLLFECMKYELDLKGRHAAPGWETSSVGVSEAAV